MFIPVEILRGAAAALGVSRVELAAAARLSTSTVRRAYEAPQKASRATMVALRAALEGRGVEFLGSEAGCGPGFRVHDPLSNAGRRLFKGARIALGLSQRTLAAASAVAPRTLVRLERGEAVRGKAIQAVAGALQRRGLAMLPGDTGSFEGFRIDLDALSRQDLRF